MSDDVRAAIETLLDALKRVRESHANTDLARANRDLVAQLADRDRALAALREALGEAREYVLWASGDGEDPEPDALLNRISALLAPPAPGSPTPMGGQPITREDAERISKDGP